MKKPPTPQDRLSRMQASFDRDYSILAEDYAYFTSDAATRPSTETRTLEAPCEPKSPEPS
jgi:hypothetical protein